MKTSFHRTPTVKSLAQMSIKIIITVLTSLLFLTTPSVAEHTIVASGLPIKKSMCDISGCKEIPITLENQASFRLSIISVKDNYFWASRDKKPLIASSSDDFYNFVAPTGEGYIKISSEEGKTVYVEHMTLGFKNITYWGVIDLFQPPNEK